MNDYTLKKVIPRTDANTIKIDTNYFELNLKAKRIVDDIVIIIEENNTVMQQLVNDIENIQPNSTYYTKEAIDERINDLNEAKNHIQLELLAQAKKNTQYDSFIREILSKVNTQIVFFNKVKEDIETLKKEIIDLKELDKSGKILNWQSIEYTSEYIRQMQNTGILSVNQVGTSMPTKPYKQPIDTSYNVLNIHNHPNYDGMPGMGWFAYQANGYMGQTRHNDYRLNSQSVSFMETVKNEAPSVSNYHFSVKNMQDLFSRYLKEELLEDEKELFRWDMSYLECWWQEVDSLDGVVSDTFDSFRHTFGNTKPTYLANRFTTSRATGKKARFENIPFFPIASKSTDDNGNTKYSLFMYRIVSYPLTALNGKRWNRVLETKEDLVNVARFGTYDDLSTRTKFKFRDDVSFDSLIETIPGVGGLGETIENYKTIDGWDLPTPTNKARYHRKYSVARDAVGRGSYANGWNDPTLITAFTENKQIVHGTSYMIPLELILRTPLETWNPNDLELKSKITGNGTTANPYNGIKENAYFYHTPSEFYDGYDGVDPADTGIGVKAVLNPDGLVSRNVASGIYMLLPSIKTVRERVRIRFPISWNAHEFSPANIALSAYKKTNDENMSLIKLHMIKR